MYRMVRVLVLVFGCVGYTHGLVQLSELIDGTLELTMVFGTVHIKEPVLIDLIKSPAFNRLKKINQYGVMCHARNEPEYTRYQHSLGVFFILRLYDAPLAEQIAGLLHDVSHTVFSHVGDYVFSHRHKKTSYQDEIHEWYLEQTGIQAILQTHGFDGVCSAAAKKLQRRFEQDLPGLCADRIEYNLTGGLIDKLLTAVDVKNILKHLHFKDGQWFFDNAAAAQQFGLVSLMLSEQRWGGPFNGFVDTCACNALKRALVLEIVTDQEIKFSVDDLVWNKLILSNDEDIQHWITYVTQAQQSFCICSKEDSDIYLRGHFSGTDPYVQAARGLQRLTELDAAYQQEYERVKKLVTQGHWVRLISC